MVRINNKIIIIISSLAVLGSIFFLYIRKQNKQEKILFKTEHPTRKNMTQYVKASGTLKALEQISVGSLVAGKVDKIYVDNNDVVQKDQVLAVLDDGIGDSAVKKLKAELKQATENTVYFENFYKRQTALYQEEQISTDQFEQYTRDLEVLRATVDQKSAELEMRVKEYNNTFIKSPVNGIVIAKMIDLGEMVTSRLDAKVLFVIAKDLKCMEAEVDVDEADIGMVKEGQNVVFTVDAFPKTDFHAKVKKVRYLAEIVDNVVTYATLLNVANKDLKLRPGMTTNVEIKVKEAKNALVVKNKTLRLDQDTIETVAKKLNFSVKRIPGTDKTTNIEHLWVAENDSFKQLPVKIGAREGKYTQIMNNNITEQTNILTEVVDPDKENLFLKQFFSKPGLGGRKKK